MKSLTKAMDLGKKMRSKKRKSRDLLQDLTGWMGKTGPSKKKTGGGEEDREQIEMVETESKE